MSKNLFSSEMRRLDFYKIEKMVRFWPKYPTAEKVAECFGVSKEALNLFIVKKTGFSFDSYVSNYRGPKT